MYPLILYLLQYIVGERVVLEGYARVFTMQKIRTWLIRTVLTVTVVIIHSIEGNSAGAIQASEWFAFFIELPFL